MLHLSSDGRCRARDCVEDVKTDSKSHMVVVKGKTADPIKPPPVITVTLKVSMHCEACAQVLQKRIRKAEGVESVVTDHANDQVVVKGVIDPAKLVDYVYKRTRKQASIVKDEEKKEEEKKEEEKKEEKEGEKKEGEEGKEEDDTKSEIKRSEYWHPKDMEYYAYSPQIFSDENPNACSVM
ncbi:hypothetical protein HHK36_023981 [Tetracentron sinense]|uniref:HMA domain-containing protein n=1 Tax=Tetracentron sinense TaxID=13715 RepID=A0A834YM89_TETSI|nr:hypothetical protein HHK36_023981 [Tetracentron sinense]